MKKMRNIVASILMLLTIVSVPVPVQAIETGCSLDSNSEPCKANTDLIGGILKNVINVMLYLAGTIAVIMVVIGGIRYITSDGDSNKANQAKNTIIYAVVGIVVSLMSFAIVNFVIGRV